mgnify:CR=1 FL=1|tara:strand:+ start:295 stop:741 length:447 start_codon:yes stop_codon:yes gene_type:complete
MRRTASEIINDLDMRINRLEGKTANSHKVAHAKITGFTSQLSASGRLTKRSWNSLDHLLESVTESISRGYVVMDNNGYDDRVDYRYVTLYEDGTHLVITASPRREDEDEEPKVDIRASLSDLLGSGATMQPVVDAFLREVKKRLPFDV